MAIVLDIFGVILMALGFWVLLSAFDRTGAERAFRIKVAIGSMLAGLGNVFFTQAQGLAILLIVIGGLIVTASRRPQT